MCNVDENAAMSQWKNSSGRSSWNVGFVEGYQTPLIFPSLLDGPTITLWPCFGDPNIVDWSSNEITANDLLEDEVQKMILGDGVKPMPVRSWRRCPLIQASRRLEFRPLPTDIAPEIRSLPEHVRTSLSGCKVFQIPQIAEYNKMLQLDGVFVSGVDKVAAHARTKPGRLYHKFDSLCALATSQGGRLLLVQHKNLNHVFYAICFHPDHNLYNETLNMYERRWYAVSDTYGKEVNAEAVAKSSSEITP